jgi:uncharacterized membrane protein
MDSQARSIAKAFSYRILGSASTGLIVYGFTGRGSLSVGASLADIFIKIGVYFVHERIWDRISFGRGRATGYEI